MKQKGGAKPYAAHWKTDIRRYGLPSPSETRLRQKLPAFSALLRITFVVLSKAFYSCQLAPLKFHFLFLVAKHTGSR